MKPNRTEQSKSKSNGKYGRLAEFILSAKFKLKRNGLELVIPDLTGNDLEQRLVELIWNLAGM